ncbi:MAG: hypothetical protein QHJ73_10120 [Armatimonadota bacterium]|nr:hypothetical protein [Armatimonadota bacterium]
MDPVLVLLDFLQHYRKSWRCWLIGGPAAVDDLTVGPAAVTAAARIEADFEYESEDRVERQVLASQARDDLWYDHPRPRPPARGEFRDEVQSFPLSYTRAFEWCLQCRGKGRKRCRACNGTGGRACEFCGGVGCPDCAERRGYQECYACGGKGWIRCTCADAQAFSPLIHYEAARFFYTHHRQVRDVLPAEALPRAAREVLRRALSAALQSPTVEAPTAEALADKAAAFLPAPLLGDLRQTAAQLQREAALPLRGRLLFQRFRAYTVPVAQVVLWAPGHIRCAWLSRASDRITGSLSVPKTIGGWFHWAAAALLAGGAAWSAASEGHLLAAVLTGVISAHQAARAFVASKKQGFWRYLHGSLLTREAPNILIVTGPDPRRSGLFFSLLAHLDSAVQLADPERGGLVVDDNYAGLLPMLLDETDPPRWSSTYRMMRNDPYLGAWGYPWEALRVVHLVSTGYPSQDPLLSRVLRRALTVFVVASPTTPADETAAWLQSVTGAAHDADVALVTESDPPPLPRGVHLLQVDLGRVRDRYLSGEMGPDEAEGTVEWLLGVRTEPPEPVSGAPAPQAGVHAAPPQRAR